jgi:hypothetical protein
MKNQCTHDKGVVMKKYRVGICYSGYVWQEVEANSEDDAMYKARELADHACHDPVITDWERWEEADEIFETK